MTVADSACAGGGTAALSGLPACVKGFARMCTDGWEQGWHERNGGNASYRLTEADAAECEAVLGFSPGEWLPLQIRAREAAKARFLVTRTGGYMRNIADDPRAGAGIVEVSPDGAAYRILWGLAREGRPTSEFSGHLLMHESRLRAAADAGASSDAADRVIYHCHPVDVVALSCAVAPEGRAITRALWKMMTECVMVFPEGVGAVGCLTPGSLALAEASAREMASVRAVVWAHHGLVAAGTDFDDAFGRMHVIVKAASMYRAACSMCGRPPFPFEVTDAELRAIAADLGVVPRRGYLDE